MATTTQPKIAHAIARLHPESEFPAWAWRRGPVWALPPARTGEWFINKVYNTAVRVEFDEALPKLGRFAVDRILDEAREALSDEEEKRRTEWLGWADKREAEAFVRKWNVRKRREYGGIPTVRAGTFVRASQYSGVWHIATGQNGFSWDAEDRQTIGTECPEHVSIDLGSEDAVVNQTTNPDRICKRCTARVASRQAESAADMVMVPA